MVKKGLDTVNNKVNASMNGNVALTEWKELANDSVMKDVHDKRASNAAESGSNTKRTNSGEIGGIFVEGDKIVGSKGVRDGGWEITMED